MNDELVVAGKKEVAFKDDSSVVARVAKGMMNCNVGELRDNGAVIESKFQSVDGARGWGHGFALLRLGAGEDGKKKKKSYREKLGLGDSVCRNWVQAANIVTIMDFKHKDTHGENRPTGTLFSELAFSPELSIRHTNAVATLTAKHPLEAHNLMKVAIKKKLPVAALVLLAKEKAEELEPVIDIEAEEVADAVLDDKLKPKTPAANPSNQAGLDDTVPKIMDKTAVGSEAEEGATETGEEDDNADSQGNGDITASEQQPGKSDTSTSNDKNSTETPKKDPVDLSLDDVRDGGREMIDAVADSELEELSKVYSDLAKECNAKLNGEKKTSSTTAAKDLLN